MSSLNTSWGCASTFLSLGARTSGASDSLKDLSAPFQELLPRVVAAGQEARRVKEGWAELGELAAWALAKATLGEE